MAFDNLIVNVSTWGVGVAALGVLFQLMLRDHLAWRNVYITATLVGMAVVVGTWAADYYFDHRGSASITGVRRGVLIFLTWLYYLAQILIAGVEFLETMEDRLPAQAEPGVSPANSGS